MTMTVGQSIIMIAAIILATVLTRFLPFIFFLRRAADTRFC